ncbi:catalase family protein [Psychrobacter sp. APC 3426]|uniref:catalase family protein n=1 Tax=Psychrobacter sp. APC 3426 TaxID=3035177 RepID=UPI0025B3203B|nr:catalase family protein [Psychrobacter sp. APC 3426]MDN3398458.1 catalase family protein [Psychrobacter sp. APC 3426]
MLKKLFKPKYVKFDDKYTTLSPEDQQTMEMITADIREYVEKSKEANDLDHHTRAVHAKSYCGLKAKFEILDNLPKEYAQGLYAKAGIHDAVIRFSNAAAGVDADRRLGLGQGLAIKIFDVPGKKLTPGEEDCTTFDYALVNGPIFFTNSLKDYAYLSKLNFELNSYLGDGLLGKGKLVFDWLTKYGKAFPNVEAVRTLNAFRKLATIPPKNAWLYDYFSQGACRHGDYMAKIRITPTKASAAKIKRRDIHLFTEDEAIRPVIIKEIQEHDYQFNVQIQLCRNLKKQPIETLTKEWDESDAPFVTVATLTVPCQEVPDDRNIEAIENLSFTTFRCLEENRPIGVIQTSRLQAYKTSSDTRHKLNGIRRKEPSSLKEVFDKSTTK